MVIVLGPVVRKPINLYQSRISANFDFVFSTFWRIKVCLFFFSELPSSNVKFCRISTLNNTLERRNKLLGLLSISD